MALTNFVVRHGTTQATTAAATAEYRAIDTDLLIVESRFAFNGGAPDTSYTPAQVAKMKSEGTPIGGKAVVAYMSVGSIDSNRDQFASFASVAEAGAGEVTLRFWEKENGEYKILQPLIGWAQALKANGYDGVFLDVLNSYTNEAVRNLISPDQGEAYRIATNALIEIIVALEAALNPNPGDNFKIALGNNPDLLLHNAFPDADPEPEATPQVPQSTIDALKQLTDYVVVESLPIEAAEHHGVPAVRFFGDTLRILDVLGVKDGGTNGAYAFGKAKVLLVSYFDAGGQFDNGELATWRSLSLQIEAARLGIIPYVTPNFAPSDPNGNLAAGTNIEPFTATHPIFNLATEDANALMTRPGLMGLLGLGGNDYLSGSGAFETFNGGSGDDLIEARGGVDILYGAEGSDTLIGGKGDDRYINPTADDLIVELPGAAQGARDRIESDASFDLRTVRHVEDVILTGQHNVNATGNGGANRLTGNTGNNKLVGDSGNDTLDGLSRDDRLAGGKGDDSLTGGQGQDTLLGGPGADTLYGGRDNDVMDGGAQADLFRFDFTSGLSGNDTINGFETGLDRFDLSGRLFTNVGETNGNTSLTYAGGRIKIAGVTGLSLEEWNALVVPADSAGHDLPPEVLVSTWAEALHAARFDFDYR